jgi:peptidoglycan biosynthesis protein MviN/MurJ (putative lipid II flippase)
VSRSRAALASAIAQALVYFLLIVAAGVVPGGVIAFQLALQTVQLPIALGARPVATALLPHLSRHHRKSSGEMFVRFYTEGLWLGGVATVPAALALIVFAPQIASVIAVGRMSVDSAVSLVEVSLIALALSVIGVALTEIARSALVAQNDFRTPAVAAWIQAAIVFAGAGLASLLGSPIAALAVLGSSVSIGELVSGWVVHRQLRHSYPTDGLLVAATSTTASMAAVALAVGSALAWTLSTWFASSDFLTLAVGGTASGAVYIVGQRLRSPDFVVLTDGWLSRVPAVVRRVPAQGWLLIGVVSVIVLANAGALFAGWLVVGVVAAAGLALVVYCRPVVATLVYVAALPLLAGMERGALLPQIRPNEALLVPLLAGLCARGVRSLARGDRRVLNPSRLDVAIVVFVVFGSLVPITWLLVRGIDPEPNDLLEPLVLWRLLAVYLIVRVTVRTAGELERVLTITLRAAAFVAVVAVVQGLGLLGAPGEAVLLTFWGPPEVLESGRASTTLASSLATGGYLAYNLAIAVAWWGTVRRSNNLRSKGKGWLAALFLVGGLAAGQFSAWLAVALCGSVAALLTGKLGLLLRRAAPVVPIAIIGAWPVLYGRLSEFGGAFGMPRSWLGRIDNLTTFYLPHLGDFGFVLGVRPNSIVQAPETWRDVIFLESGFLWLLWVGGIPFLLAFCWMVAQAARAASRAARAEAPLAIVGGATGAALVCLVVLSIIDKHLQLRGAGDLLFVMLALTLVGSDPTPDGRHARNVERPQPAVMT